LALEMSIDALTQQAWQKTTTACACTSLHRVAPLSPTRGCTPLPRARRVAQIFQDALNRGPWACSALALGIDTARHCAPPALRV